MHENLGSDETRLPGEPAYAAVLVPLDGSEGSEAALDPARALAGRFGAELHAVSAGVARAERWWWERYASELPDRRGEVTLHLSADGDVAGTVLATARDLAPCLVCLATHGRARSAAIVGSTFARLAARADAPLVAVGPGVVPADRSPGRLLVCLDGSPTAERALPVAAGWARRFGWSLSVATAADPVMRPPEHEPAPSSYLDEIAARRDLAGLPVDATVLWGAADPHVVIGDLLDEQPADLVVLTTHARTGLARVALGSEAARIIRRCPVPVLVVPPGAGVPRA